MQEADKSIVKHRRGCLQATWDRPKGSTRMNATDVDAGKWAQEGPAVTKVKFKRVCKNMPMAFQRATSCLAACCFLRERGGGGGVSGFHSSWTPRARRI
jgi:hypothetical protein